MKFSQGMRRRAATLLTIALVMTVAAAQQPTPAPRARAEQKAPAPKAPEVTLDTLFAADDYAIYGEMRSVGQFFSSAEFKEMLEPVRLGGAPTAESNTGPSVALPGLGLLVSLAPTPALNSLVEFFNSHAEALASSRIVFGTMPAADGLPNAVAAVELSSVEDAQKLEPQLRAFLASNFTAPSDSEGPQAAKPGATKTTATNDSGATGNTATLSASPGAAEGPGGRGARRRAQLGSAQAVKANEKAGGAAVAPFFIRRAGAVIAIADKRFTFKGLGGGGERELLSNEPGFQAARSRLATDTFFLYFNTTRMSRATKRLTDEYERQRKRMEMEAEQARNSGAGYSGKITSRSGSTSIVVVSRNSNSVAVVAPEAITVNGNVAVANNSSGDNSNRNSNGSPPPEPFAGMSPEERALYEATMVEVKEAEAKEAEEEAKRKAEPGYEEGRRRQAQQREFENQLGRLVFNDSASGGSWAESIGVGASLSGEDLVVRALFVADPGARELRPIPFMPILLSGPQLAPEAASVLPKDADIYATASLDLPQMYDYVASAFKLFDMAAAAAGESGKQGLFDSQVSAFEKANSLRIREDLLNSLGNEIAVCLPSDYLGVRRPRKRAKPETAGATTVAATDSTDEPQAKPESQTFSASPVVVVSLNDKKALQELLPRALEGMGMKGVGEQGMIQKRGDTEVLAFSGGSAAFIDRFLVLASDPATLDWVIDAYNRRETLANSEEFRAAAGWQERQVLGQVYVSNALLKGMFGDVTKSIEDIDDHALRAYLTRLDPSPGAVTHSLTRDAGGLFHELHVPKNLLTLWTASALVARQIAPLRRNETMAIYALYNVANMQQTYKNTNGRYATLAELEAQLKKENADEPYEQEMTTSFLKVEGYQIKLNVSGDKFDVTATPTGYPKQGRRSFYVDQTNALRGGDTKGKPATAASEPINGFR